MINIILFIVAKLPLRLLHIFGTLFGLFLYYTNTKSKQSIEFNIALCLMDLSIEEQSSLTKKNLINLGKTIFEAPFIWQKNAQKNVKLVKSVYGLEHIKGDDNIIMLIPHIGSWELVGRYTSTIKTTTMLYKQLRNKKFDKILLKYRQEDNYNLVNTKFSGIAKLQKAIKNKNLVGILPDQSSQQDNSSIEVEFFGIKTTTTTLLAKLTRKYNAKIVLAYAKRLDYGRGFDIHFQDVNILSKENTLYADCLLINKHIENLVKQMPEQYLWQYKRFKFNKKYNK